MKCFTACQKSLRARVRNALFARSAGTSTPVLEQEIAPARRKYESTRVMQCAAPSLAAERCTRWLSAMLGRLIATRSLGEAHAKPSAGRVAPLPPRARYAAAGGKR